MHNALSTVVNSGVGRWAALALIVCVASTIVNMIVMYVTCTDVSGRYPLAWIGSVFIGMLCLMTSFTLYMALIEDGLSIHPIIVVLLITSFIAETFYTNGRRSRAHEARKSTTTQDQPNG